jgi:hypothetical protein
MCVVVVIDSLSGKFAGEKQRWQAAKTKIRKNRALNPDDDRGCILETVRQLALQRSPAVLKLLALGIFSARM